MYNPYIIRFRKTFLIFGRDCYGVLVSSGMHGRRWSLILFGELGIPHCWSGSAWRNDNPPVYRSISRCTPVLREVAQVYADFFYSESVVPEAKI